MLAHGTSHGSVVVPRSYSLEGPFGRLFRNLPAWDPPGREEREKLRALEQLAEQMVGSAEEVPEALDNSDVPAGYTYFGQFIDHDITFDTTSSLQRMNDPDRLHNFRTPGLDLDCLYGRGPVDQPFLFERPGPGGRPTYRFHIGKGRDVVGDTTPHLLPAGIHLLPVTAEEDLPRNEQGLALIGDPRNDENILLSQLHLIFLKLHNKLLVDRIWPEQGIGKASFLRAQQLVRWHYQWLVLHDFLPRLVGDDLVDELLVGNGEASTELTERLQFYKPQRHRYMPVEFSAAAFRMGHSMVRSEYRLNGQLEGPIPIMQAPGPFSTLLDDLSGHKPLPQDWSLDWSFFLPLGPDAPQPSRRIVPRLNRRLANIPVGFGVQDSLARRNLVRGWRLGLPSGQAVARAMRQEKVYSNEELGLEQDFGVEAPLWFYCLREAEIEHGGQRLGSVAARIVAEVLVGLITYDPFSYLNVAPGWQPEIPSENSEFELRDLVRFTLA